ncbi:MAG: glycosyltransferase family 4 protein [Lachnospiraceae bacterium]|nr:glycosyltransferase family 4 protein [Lachnospiraceae bacterium]
MSHVLIINPILYTAETNRIPKVSSIKDTMIYTLCLGFLKQGHLVTLIAAQDYRPEADEDYDFPILFMRTAGHKVFQPRCFPYMPELRGYLKKHQEYDLIISSEVFGTWSYTAARVCPEKTLIWHELAKHNNILHKLPSRIWYHIVARFMMRKSPVIPRSEAAMRFISRFVPHVSDFCIDHGVDLKKFPKTEPAKKQNRFVVVSQFIERKKIDRTILQFEVFRKRGHRDYRLYLIGQGELEKSYRELITQHQLEDAVILCGQMRHEQLLPFVAESKAMLVSTVKDNNMVSIVESIAAGTPVITTSVPYNAAYIQSGELGIVADDWGVDALEEICAENEKYVRNCIAYREKLSNTSLAEQFVEYARLYWKWRA